MRSRGTLRRRILATCTVVVLMGGIACLGARLGSVLPAGLGNALDPLNGVIAPVLLAMALASQVALCAGIRVGAALSLLTLALGGWQVAAIRADVAPRSVAANPMVRVLTLSAYHDNLEPWRLRTVIERSGADIVMLQESDGSAAGEIARTLPAFHRVVDCAQPPCPLTILSRWPVRRVATPMPTATELPSLLVAEATLPGGPIDVVALHLPRSHLPRAGPFRALTTEALRHLTAPGIVAGDFNLAAGGPALAQVARETGLLRADTWIATFPADMPVPAFAAIDHVFVDRSFGVRGCARLPFAGSDHFGIRCDIILPARAPVQAEPAAPQSRPSGTAKRSE